MTISAVASSVTFTPSSRPKPLAPTVDATSMVFDSNPLQGVAAATLTGAAGDLPNGWTFGFIQLKWISTDWACYSGQHERDGNIFVQAARPPARPSQGCRDTIDPAQILFDTFPGKDRTVLTASTTFPKPVTAEFFDQPRRTWPSTRLNTTTHALNYIYEAQTEAHFCTIIVLLSPTGVRHPLKHFYWNVHWQASFRPSDYSDLSKPWRINVSRARLANIGTLTHLSGGAPSDPRFAPLLTAANPPHCNTLVRDAMRRPNIREHRNWQSFDVRR